ncbi:TPA: hypothetical protein N2G38_005557 [Salmonella enterica]|nr:hypothetical protein [Salmonella enterica subsp. enterica]HCL5313134.1 hypothetical protein [Salmonella enterica]
MADYFIRVELHEADKPFAYEELHKKMEAHGYHRQIQLPQNPDPRYLSLRDVARIAEHKTTNPTPTSRYQLPTAVYILKSDLPINTIVQNVKDIASEISPNPMVVVVNYSEIDYCNLPKV